MPEEFDIKSACMSYFNASYDRAQLRHDMAYRWPENEPLEEEDDWPEEEEPEEEPEEESEE